MNCVGAECDNALYGDNFFAFTIEQSVGEQLKTLLQSIGSAAQKTVNHVKCRANPLQHQQPRLDGEPELSANPLTLEDLSGVPLCNLTVQVSASAVGAQQSVLVQVFDDVGPGVGFAVDGGRHQFPNGPLQQSLRELGVFLYPSLEFYGWADQYLGYQQRLDKKMQDLLTLQQSFVVKVFDGEATGGINKFTRVNVTLPSKVDQLAFSELYIEMELGWYVVSL